MSSNQRKNNNQRRSNYNNNNNQQQQQQNNKNQHQQQKRPRYQPKQYNNNNNNNNNSNNTNNNQPKQQYNYSPKQQPKRYNQRTGPSSPNNRSQNQNRHHYDQSHPSHPNNSNQQRFKLKPTNTNNNNNNNNNQNRGYNTQNRNYNNNNNSNNNQSPYNRSRRNNNPNNNNPNHPYNTQSNQNNNNNDLDLNNSNNKQMPPGFRQNNDNPDYPPNRYRPNDTNNSERNRNWRNRYTPVDTSANTPNYNLNNSRQHHSRSPQSGPSHQHHAHPLHANNNNNGDLNMNMFENTSNRNNLSGSDHSASHSMTPHGPQRESNKAMDAATTTPVAAGAGGVGPGGGSSDIGGSDSAAGELFGAIYAQNGVEPSIAYPVIKLCLNNDVDGDDNNALASDSKIQRKYPVDWLLGVGKEIRDPPNHPKDDIPDSVKFINTIKIAGNRWKQHHNQAQNANMNTNPGIHAHAHTNSPIPTNNRFGNIHQLTPRQLPLNNNHSPLNTNNNNPNDDRSWRKLNPLQLNQTINKKATGPNEHDLHDSAVNNENDNDHLGATPNDDANHVPIPNVVAPDPERIKPANPTDEAPPPHPTEANNATDDAVIEPPQQTLHENEAEAAPVPALYDIGTMPINNTMISAEAIEEELLRRQQAQTAQAVTTQDIIADAVAVAVPASADADNVSGAALPQPGQAHPPPAATLASSADVAVMAAAAVEEEEDLDQYKPVNITPELKPDPREMVEEELGIAPEWAREDDPSNNEEITKTDFQFAAVIDKEKDREYIKQSGGVLPETTTTITHEEYQRRKEESKGPKKPPIPHQSRELSHPLPAPDGIGSLRSQMFGVGRVGSLRSQSTPDGLATYGRDTATNEPLPIDKLPSRIRGIVVRLDEDIAKISTYIQQVALEKDQLNRYQRHLHKLIARRGQYANWWKAQQKKQQVLGGAAGDIAKPNVSVGLRHTNSLQQLEHYKDYYNKQLDKMIISAQTDTKFNTYVDYYRQKLKAVEKRQRELESRQKVVVEAPLEAQALDKEKGASAMDVMNDEAIKNAIKRQSDNAVKAQMPLTINNNAADNNEDPFASLMNLSDLGYTQATTQHNKPQSTPVHKVTQQQPVCNNEEAMHAYIYGAPRHQQSPPQPQVQPQPQPQVPVQPQAQPQPQAAVPHKRDISHQKQKLKAYIRQHALKYVKPPPDPKDETYPHWYQGLRKVENIIYAKYMNKQRKRMEAQQKEYEQMKKQNEHGMDGRSPPSHPQKNDFLRSAYRGPAHSMSHPQPTASSHPQHVSQLHGHGGHAQHPHSPYGPGPGPHSMHRGMPQGNGPPAQHPHSPYGPPSGAHSHGSPYGALPPHGPPMPNGSPVGTQHGAYGPQHHLHPSQQSPPNMMPQHAQQYGAPPGPPPGPPNPHQYNKSPYGHPSAHPVSHSGHGSPQQVSHHTQGSPVSHGTHSQAPHHRMAHLNISPTAQGHNPPRSPPPQQQPQLQGYPPVPQKDVHTHTTHTLPPQAQSHHPSAQHPQSMNSPPMAMSYYANMSPPLSPQNQQQHSNKYHHALDNRYHRGYAHPAQQQSPPNPGNNGNAQNAQNPTTTSHGYTTYNTQSPPSNQAMYQQQHQYQASQRSPPNPHQYPMHYQDIAEQ